MDLKFLQCQGHEKYCRNGKVDDLTVLKSAETFSPIRKNANLRKCSTNSGLWPRHPPNTSRCPFACGCAALLMSRWQALRLVQVRPSAHPRFARIQDLLRKSEQTRYAPDWGIALQFLNSGALCIFARICLLVSKLPAGNLAHLHTACRNAQLQVCWGLKC